ncbi:hypothetical protein [Cupriavidus necator]
MKAAIQRVSASVAVVLVLAGCAAAGPTITNPAYTENHYQAFVNGQVRLDCELACSGNWGSNRREAKTLYETHRWKELVSKVMEIGYGKDLTYFYLGRAAEGLGFFGAAETYYGLAMRATPCAGVINTCDGLNFPHDITYRLPILKPAQADAANKLAVQAVSPSVAQPAKTVNTNTNGIPEKQGGDARRNDQVVDLKTVTSLSPQTEATPTKTTASPAHPRYIPKGDKGDSITALIDKFRRIDELAKDEFTKRATIEARTKELQSKEYRFLFSRNTNYGFKAPIARYDAESEVLKIDLELIYRTFILNSQNSVPPKYFTLSLLERHSGTNYVGQNGFGARFNVRSIVSNEYGLALENFGTSGLADDMWTPILSTTLPLPPAAAKAMKSDLMFYVDAALISTDSAKGNVLQDVEKANATSSDPTEVLFARSFLLARVKEVGVFRKSTGEILAWKTLP